jgi:hypothetical protein
VAQVRIDLTMKTMVRASVIVIMTGVALRVSRNLIHAAMIKLPMNATRPATQQATKSFAGSAGDGWRHCSPEVHPKRPKHASKLKLSRPLVGCSRKEIFLIATLTRITLMPQSAEDAQQLCNNTLELL